MWWSVWAVAAWWCAGAAGCDVTFDGRNYTEEVLARDVEAVSGLAVDYNTNTLYVSYYDSSTRRNGKLDLGSKVLTIIEELSEACSFTVNQALGEVHAGCFGGDGTDGLYQWDSNSRKFELAGEAGRGVYFVHYNNGTLYYSLYPDALLRTFRLGRSVLQPAPTSEVRRFVVNGRGDWVYTNWTGMYRRRRGGTETEETLYKKFNDEVWALATDPRGVAYCCSHYYPQPGVWRLHDSGVATQLLHVRCKDLTFDADGNLIYADVDRHVIARLLPC